MTKNWINFRFLHICPVEKCEISPNLAKIHISPHLLCGKTEIPLHVMKFHVLKSEISPHGRFLLHLHVGDRGDKYQVCINLDFVDPEEEEGLDQNEEGEGVNQPDSGEKLNKCNQCDYACSDPSVLRTHLKMHTGEKPSKCNRCGEYCSWWCLP